MSQEKKDPRKMLADQASWILAGLLIFGAGWLGRQYLKSREETTSIKVIPPSPNYEPPKPVPKKPKEKKKEEEYDLWFNIITKEELMGRTGISEEGANKVINARDQNQGLQSFDDLLIIADLSEEDRAKLQKMPTEGQDLPPEGQ